MLRRFGLAAALGAAALCFSPSSAPAATLMPGGRGRLAPPEGVESDARGFFRIAGINARVADLETLKVKAFRLDATLDADGNLPTYHFFLVTSDGAKEADFGPMTLAPSGNARLLFRSWRDDYPADVSSLGEFGGGRAEVRRGDDVVLLGEVPPFVRTGRPEDGGGGGGGGGGGDGGVKASTLVRVELTATAGDDDAAGLLVEFHADGSMGSIEGIRLVCSGLAQGEYQVVAEDLFGNRTVIGSFEANAAGAGNLEVSGTPDGMPGGGLAALAGQTILVLDAAGEVVLTGTFAVIGS
jgi:hypothetical protein